MARSPPQGDAAAVRFARTCRLLERAGRLLGMSAPKTLAKAKRRAGGGAARLGKLARDLELADIRCLPEQVVAAARSLGSFIAIGGAAAPLLSALLLDQAFLAPVLAAAVAAPLLSYRYIIGYPSTLARRRASELLKSSSEAVNLMIMGVRQDSSLPKAIGFASSGSAAFSKELRRCTWEVVTGTHSSFEEALHALGSRWEGFCAELKTALNAIVLASREATDEGRRRSLERANRAMVAGAKRRVEEYALSLSTPSMLLFGLGILLPIMVGSFMPMLSWDIWSGTSLDGAATPTSGPLFETAMVMDLMFPVVAFLVAADAVSRRPVDGRAPKGEGGCGPGKWLASVTVGIACAGASYVFLSGPDIAPATLLAGVMPASAVLLASGRRARVGGRAEEAEAQDLLFRMGARMLDGDNFESALHRSAQVNDQGGQSLGKRLCMKAFVLGHGLERAVSSEARGETVNALEALKVVGRASTKDEAEAGMLAMDFAAYLRELSEIESTLKMRLRPTISMMRMTAHALGPIVLGVTFAVYVSLGSVAGGYGDNVATGAMLLVLGVFLAEMNAVVCYFVWGIEGGSDSRQLARSAGACILVSQLVFVSTAVLVA